MRVCFAVVWMGLICSAQDVGAQFTLSCDSFCVLSISMDTLPNTIDVTILNANAGHVNYPVPILLDANGDTVAGTPGNLTLFAQMGHTTVTYPLATTLTSLPTGFTGTVMFSDELWDTTCALAYPCMSWNHVSHPSYASVNIYPIPAQNNLVIQFDGNVGNKEVLLFDGVGRTVYNARVNKSVFDLSTAGLADGVYYLRICSSTEHPSVHKVVVLHLTER